MPSSPNPFFFPTQQTWISSKEPMFEKPLTPSDVGKLNRLVIPKQYAEKYFPLDSEAGEKGLLLSFEDENGCKLWRFRYSYWTSSQSYVLTKGWSKFVKEKQLDAGDSVIFLRLGGNADRHFIGCRRKGKAQPSSFCQSRSLANESYLFLNAIPHGVEERSSEAAAGSAGNSKRLRLFGVNLECGHLLGGSHQVVTANASAHQI